MTSTGLPSGSFQDEMAKSWINNSEFAINLGGTVFVTTEEKVRLAVLTHLRRIEDRKGWIAPLGIVITIAVIFPTTEFKPAFLSAATWQAIFIVVLLLSAAWLIYQIVAAVRSPSVDDLVNALRVPTASEVSRSNIDEAALPKVRFSKSSDLARWTTRIYDTSHFQSLTSNRWVLIFNRNHAQGRKFMSFNPDGTIGEGRNNNEFLWTIADGILSFIQSDGKAHSRFEYRDGKWVQKEDPETPNAHDQSMVIVADRH